MNHQQSLLKRLNIQHVNPGVCTGPDGWLDSGAPPLVSFNPTTGEPLASVIPATPHTVDQAVAAARANFETWRQLPAPRRGLVVRDLGLAVRESLEPLGELITLEMGKIRAEGIGEVQEMIDICDFAVGLSRQLYGLTIATERPGHRMMETWHPLGVVGVISAFNFPVAVWSWNAALALVCGNSVVWKPSEKTPLTALACQAIFDKAAARAGGAFAPFMRSYIYRSGAPLDVGPMVAVKDRKNALKNPYAHLKIEDISIDFFKNVFTVGR